MNKRQIIVLSIVIIAIASITIYIELVMKPSHIQINSNKESPFAIYIHPNMNITMDNRPVVIPSQIGINKTLWENHSLDKFGVPGMPMDEEGEKTMPGMAPLYATNDKGRITTGSVIERDYTLGEFLKIWSGIDIKDKLVNATVNGKPVDDYRNIILKDKAQIKLVIYSHQ